jgi:hypothetical protein
MNTHLTDEQIAAAVAGLELDEGAREHLAACLGCRAAVSDMQRLIETRRAGIVAEEPDWEAQRAGVLAGLQPQAPVRRRPRWRTPALAAAAAVVMAVAVGVVLSPGGGPVPGEDFALEEVLAEAETLLADDSIPGFEAIDPGLDELEDFLSADTLNGGAS